MIKFIQLTIVCNNAEHVSGSLQLGKIIGFLKDNDRVIVSMEDGSEYIVTDTIEDINTQIHNTLRPSTLN
jgi:hypothetical protein